MFLFVIVYTTPARIAPKWWSLCRKLGNDTRISWLESWNVWQCCCFFGVVYHSFNSFIHYYDYVTMTQWCMPYAWQTDRLTHPWPWTMDHTMIRWPWFMMMMGHGPYTKVNKIFLYTCKSLKKNRYHRHPHSYLTSHTVTYYWGSTGDKPMKNAGLQGRPNFNNLDKNDPEILRAWKYLGLTVVESLTRLLTIVDGAVDKCVCVWEDSQIYVLSFLLICGCRLRPQANQLNLAHGGDTMHGGPWATSWTSLHCSQGPEHAQHAVWPQGKHQEVLPNLQWRIPASAVKCYFDQTNVSC